MTTNKNNTNKIPAGKEVYFEDDIVAVYDPSGEIDYKGIWDFCPYKNDFEDFVWDPAKKNYTHPAGYALVCFE